MIGYQENNHPHRCYLHCWLSSEALEAVPGSRARLGIRQSARPEIAVTSSFLIHMDILLTIFAANVLALWAVLPMQASDG